MSMPIDDEIYSSIQIKRGAMMSYAAIFINIAAGLVYTPWMIKQIGRSQYALYALALSALQFFTMDFGLGAAVSRFLSRYKATGEEASARDFLGMTFKMYLIIDAAIFIATLFIFVFAGKIYGGLTPEEVSQFKVVFFIAAVHSILTFPLIPLRGILMANERFIFLNFAGMLRKVLAIASIVTVLLLGYGLYALVAVNAVSGLIITGLKLRYAAKNKLISINFRAKNKTILRSVFGYSAWVTITALAGKFVFSITPTVLGAFADSVQISLFAVATGVAAYAGSFTGALGGLFLPKVTRLSIKKASQSVEDLMIKVGRIQLAITGLIIIGFITMGREFIILWLGEGFKEAYYIALMLIVPGIIIFTQQIGETMMHASNKIRYTAFCRIITAVISLGLSLVLTRFYGAIGAGIAIFTGTMAGTVLGKNLVYHRVLKINIIRFLRECHLRMVFPLISVFIAGILIQRFFPVEKLSMFFAKAFIFGIIYFILIWFTGLNKYEKNLFAGLFRKSRT